MNMLDLLFKFLIGLIALIIVKSYLQKASFSVKRSFLKHKKIINAAFLVMGLVGVAISFTTLNPVYLKLADIFLFFAIFYFASIIYSMIKKRNFKKAK